jgi:hypothetical protein
MATDFNMIGQSNNDVGQQRLTFNYIRTMANQAGFARDFQTDFYLEGMPKPFDILLPAQTATISTGTIGPDSSGFGHTRLPLDDTISLTTVDSSLHTILENYRSWAERTAPGFRMSLPLKHAGNVRKLTVVWYHTKYDLDASFDYGSDNVFSPALLKRLATSAISNAMNPILDEIQLKAANALAGMESKLFSDRTNVSYRDLINIPSLRARAYSALITDREYAITRTVREFHVIPASSIEESFDVNSTSASMVTMNFKVIGGGIITSDYDHDG